MYCERVVCGGGGGGGGGGVSGGGGGGGGGVSGSGGGGWGGGGGGGGVCGVKTRITWFFFCVKRTPCTYSQSPCTHSHTQTHTHTHKHNLSQVKDMLSITIQACAVRLCRMV